MCELLVDTDVLMKLALYGLLEEIAHAGCAADCGRRTGIIGAAAYVARKRLHRRATDADSATARLEAFLATVARLEPTENEVEMAAAFEAAASRAGVGLDTGESQLCVIALTRGEPVILTGDKRAILAIERLTSEVEPLTALANRVACLEQALKLVVRRIGALLVRASVQAERAADTAISICFRVTIDVVPDDFEAEGLDSYIEAVRREAPNVLLPGSELDLSAVP